MRQAPSLSDGGSFKRWESHHAYATAGTCIPEGSLGSQAGSIHEIGEIPGGHAHLGLLTGRHFGAVLQDLLELQALSPTVTERQEEVLNDYTFQVTQGVVEGENNRVKPCMCRAFGCRGFTNLGGCIQETRWPSLQRGVDPPKR